MGGDERRNDKPKIIEHHISVLIEICMLKADWVRGRVGVNIDLV